MANDDFDLREMLGDVPDPDVKLPTILDTPASQLAAPGHALTDEEIHALEVAKTRETLAKAHDPNRVPMQDRPVVKVDLPSNLPDSPLVVSPLLPEEKLSLDDEYYSTFNGTIVEVKDLEAEDLQKLRHRLFTMIRRAKIQLNAIKITEEGKLSLIDATRRAKIKANDAEFMSKRKAQGDATTPGDREKKAKKEAGEKMSQLEKQIKQFVKLSMNEATIRTTLGALGTAIPENLTELISKHKK